MSDKFKKYLSEELKTKDFDELLKGGLNDSQREALDQIKGTVDYLSRDFSKSIKGKNYEDALSVLHQLHSSLITGVKLLKNKSD